MGWRHYNENNHNERHYNESHHNEKQLQRKSSQRNAITTKKLVPFVVVDKGTSLLVFGIFRCDGISL